MKMSKFVKNLESAGAKVRAEQDERWAAMFPAEQKREIERADYDSMTPQERKKLFPNGRP